MAEQHFTHLHLHTDYSLLDGAITLEKLVGFGKTHNLKALAITDHGNIFGAVKFFQLAKKAGIKPIVGMEAYFTHDVKVKAKDDKYNHLILLVENEIGYRNLCKLIAYSYSDGFYFKPRIDYRILEKHSEGLIVTSACLGGHVPSLLMQDQYDEAHQRLRWFQDVFGPERFYLEVQPDDQEEQTILNNKLFDISAQTGIGLVAAGDCHYTTAEDREAHEVMLSIQTQNKITDPKRFSFGDCRVHMRTPDEMLELFKDHPEAVWNSGKIADRCSFEFTTGKLFFPQYPLPPQTTEESHFRALCLQGLQALVDNNRIPVEKLEAYRERLTEEMDLIITMGFVGYFLVVSDFIQWAKRAAIPVGPGRGSAAGSLVAWALEITDIDPLKYNLLFERFLNPERVTMPDIDIDFCIEGRERVIEYVRERYGHDHVCQIITFGTMLAKAVIKDVARVLGIPFEDSNALTDLIPEQLKITLTEALEQEPRLKQLVNTNPQVAKLFDIAFRLEGLTRHASKHAAGLVITPQPVTDMLPVYVPPKTSDLVTQYAMTELETLGFLKMDFLGLKNLTLIDRAVKLIKQNHGITLNIVHLPLDDKKTFELICRGGTSGVFQLESSGLKDVLRRLQPDKFEDIIAVNALYRPGPLGSGMVDDYIERRHGRQKIVYLFPELEPVLQETYGVIVYQEQVMKIASTIAGFSLGESDILRRAMGKKKADVMAEQKAIFVERAIKNNFDSKKAGELFDLMAYFAGYGFNKSHSAAYALIAYQTAYLKANYPAEFMACLISLEATDSEKMAFYMSEAQDLGLTILPPDINKSQIQFSVVSGAILFGLQGIKSVGLAAIENILACRAEKPFKDMYDFFLRVDHRTVNKRVVEHLICAGAFDNMPGHRAQKYNEVETLLERSTEKKQALLTGQMGLFGGGAETPAENEVYNFQLCSEWSISEKLEKELEVMGLYISGHPLDTHKKYLPFLSLTPLTTINPEIEQTVTMCGIIKTMKTIYTKKGDQMAFITLEYYNDRAEVIIFPKTYARVHELLQANQQIVVKGQTDPGAVPMKIKAQDIYLLEKVLHEGTGVSEAVITVPALDADKLTVFAQTIKQHCNPGQSILGFILEEDSKFIKLTTKSKISISKQFLEYISTSAIKCLLQI